MTDAVTESRFVVQVHDATALHFDLRIQIGQVRAAEDSDADCTRWPRSKARDDATVIYWPQ